MLAIFTGTPGSGKSVHATQLCLSYLAKGRHVIANYELDRDKIPNADLYEFVPNACLDPKDLLHRARLYQSGGVVEDSVLLVIDEAGGIFNSRSWQRADREGWIKFFTQSRKMGYLVVLVAQMDKMIDRQIRDILEYEFVHHKVSNYGLLGWIVGSVFGGKLHVCKQIYHPTGDVIGSRWFIVRKKVYDVYDTFTIVTEVE